MKERCDREWPQRSFWCSLGEIRGWDHNPKQLNNQQRGQHRRLGKAHGAREDPEAASFRRARNAPWAALAGRIMPSDLLRHTMSCSGPHEVAYFVGKGETNGVVELSRLRGSERYAVCFDARQAAVAGVESKRPFPRAVRAAKLCPRCSPLPGRELQIRRKKNHSDIL